MMEKRTRFVFIAVVFAIIIPIGISVFLIKKSYELERKKFDIEVTQIAGNVFFSFQADYDLLDSLINNNVFLLHDSLNSAWLHNGFQEDMYKVYRAYSGIKDSLSQKFANNNYEINFKYSLEINEFRISENDKQVIYVTDSLDGKKTLILFGDLKKGKTTASYNFYHMGKNNYIRIQLNIDYPGKNNFILRRIWPLVTGIFVSMLVLILILIYTLKVLFWQKRLSEMKSHFIDNITHEFNTPVSTLKLAAASIKQLNRKYNSEDLEKIGVRINNQASRLSGLIKKVMRLSLEQEGKMIYEFKIMHLNDFISEIIKKFKMINADKPLLLETDFKAIYDYTFVDEYYMKVALLNILDNALKYSNEKAEIKVSTLNLDNSIGIEIKDNGPGIHKKYQKHIFKRFYRANNLKQYKTQGLGLGLSIVKQIIEEHKGTITVESAVGEGSCFKITVPLKKEDE